MIGDAMAAESEELYDLELRLAAEELAVLCRGHEPALALLLPELEGVEPLDVVERTLVARGFLELAPAGGTRAVPFAEDLVTALSAPASVEHVTVDELGGGPGFWMAIAHGDEVAVTITPTEAAGVFAVAVSGPYEPASGLPGEAELETSLGRLEELLTARREDTLEPDPEDRAAALVFGASSYVERARRTVNGSALEVEHRVIVDAADLGTFELAGLPSPADGDEADGQMTISWFRLPDEVEDSW